MFGRVVLFLVGLFLVSLVAGDFCSFTDLPAFDPRDVLVSGFEPSDPRAFATIGNGYLGTVLGNESVYISGIYNGEATTGLYFYCVFIVQVSGQTGPSHRARIPSPVAINIMGVQPCGVALNVRTAMYMRRYVVRDHAVNHVLL